jgi:hypothetical protein
MEISEENPFKKKKMKMSGYILTRTELNKIPGAEKKDWLILEKDYLILRQEGNYLEKIFKDG